MAPWLLLGPITGPLWMDPVAGLFGTLVIARWSYDLIRDTGAVLLDMVPDRSLAAEIRSALEADGDRLRDLHLWRLGPGHLGATVSIATLYDGDNRYYRDRLSRFSELSHLTVEVDHPGSSSC